MLNFKTIIKRYKGKIFIELKRVLILVKDATIYFTKFIFFLNFYLLDSLIRWLDSKHLISKVIKDRFEEPASKIYDRVIDWSQENNNSTSRITLIDLAIRNMQYKRLRTSITIIGMSIGVGIIVFLVSVGYGLQELIVSRVVRLEEMKQTDVFIQPGSQLVINDESLAAFSEISNVFKVMPVVSVVARVNYENSVSDLAVYGVTADYLEYSAIRPVKGEIFASNDLAYQFESEPDGIVAGVSSQLEENAAYGQEIEEVEFEILANEWIKVRTDYSRNSEVFGYTKSQDIQQTGAVFWGDSYVDNESGKAAQDSQGNWLGKWIKSNFLLWEKRDGEYVTLRNDDENQVLKTGYVAEINMRVNPIFQIKDPVVLGLEDVQEDESQDEIEIIDEDEDWVEIASDARLDNSPRIKAVDLASSAQQEAIVNRAMLNVLGIKDDQAIGKTFKTTFVVTSDLLAEENLKIESTPSEYTIIGVTPEEQTAFFYVPFIDIRGLGVSNYSQAKLIALDQQSLAKIRQQVEVMGFMTNSVVDTVEQINSLFGTARKIFALVGMIALAVAALGMFNTLTVSLLERTREIGLMKAMGMKSNEIKELFLAESMIMSFFGGVGGIIVGFLAGKALGLVLSLLTVVKGLGFVDVSSLPILFTIVIFLLSLIVGVITGVYPARRATKISALDAIRYE